MAATLRNFGSQRKGRRGAVIVIIMVPIEVPPEPKDRLILAEEAAAMLYIKKETLLAGKAGTRSIPRQGKRPVTYRVRDIEDFIRERSEQVMERRERSWRKYEWRKHKR